MAPSGRTRIVLAAPDAPHTTPHRPSALLTTESARAVAPVTTRASTLLFSAEDSCKIVTCKGAQLEPKQPMAPSLAAGLDDVVLTSPATTRRRVARTVRSVS